MKKLKALEKQLYQLEKIELPKKLKKLGESWKDSSDAWHQNAAFEQADEELAVLRIRIIELKKEIQNLKSQN